MSSLIANFAKACRASDEATGGVVLSNYGARALYDLIVLISDPRVDTNSSKDRQAIVAAIPSMVRIKPEIGLLVSSADACRSKTYVEVLGLYPDSSRKESVQRRTTEALNKLQLLTQTQQTQTNEP